MAVRNQHGVLVSVCGDGGPRGELVMTPVDLTPVDTSPGWCVILRAEPNPYIIDQPQG